MNKRIVAFFIIIFFCNLFFLIYAHYTLQFQYKEFKTITSHISKLTADISYAHLWVEEYMIGDRSIDLNQDIYQNLQDKKLISFFNSISFVTQDSYIIKEIQSIHKLYIQFNELTKKRLSNGNKNIAGSDFDQHYDKEYIKFNNTLTGFISYIRLKEDNELSKNTLYFYIIVFLFFILNIGIFRLVYFYTRKKQEDEQKIFEQSKLASMGEMIGNIAHQWRQPLSVISTAATGIKFKKELNALDDDELIHECDNINENAQYLSKTIDDFRKFIKGDRKIISFSIHKNINSFLSIVDTSIKNHNLQVRLDLQEDIQINGYPNELIQCFINVFNNAKDALKQNVDPSERFIFITQKIKEKHLVISFLDNGGGIAKKNLSRVFEPYFTTKHQSVGTGLGLSISYNLIVKGMAGDIEVKNKTYKIDDKEYTGASFKISLPFETTKK